MRDYPVGKAQQMVLDALNITATGHGDADRIFRDLGLAVSSKRQGRKSVPVITVKDRFGGGFNASGEGVEFRQYPNADFSSISKWVEG